MQDAIQTTNTNDDLEDLTSRVSEVERRLAIHNHADPYSQPIWVGNSSQGTANIVKPPSTGVMGENCSNGDALGFGSRTGVSAISQTSQDSNVTFRDYGDAFYNVEMRQKFTYTGVAGTLKYLTLKAYWQLQTSGYPLYAHFYIKSDNNGSIGDTLGTVNLEMSSTFGQQINGEINVDLSSMSLNLVNGTVYWIDIVFNNNDGGTSSAIWAHIYYNSTNVYNNSFYCNRHDTQNQTPINGGDLYFKISVNHSPSLLYRSSSNTTTELLNYVGISNKDCKQGETADITTWGFKNDYSNLTVGAPYYLTNTYGTIGTSPGTNSKQVGIGFSPTTLLIGNH